jgi:hypothetical protein
VTPLRKTGRNASEGVPGANGQGVNAFGGLWYVLSSSGDEITTSAGSGGALATPREMGRERRTPRAPWRDEFPWPTEPGNDLCAAAGRHLKLRKGTQERAAKLIAASPQFDSADLALAREADD